MELKKPFLLYLFSHLGLFQQAMTQETKTSELASLFREQYLNQTFEHRFSQGDSDYDQTQGFRNRQEDARVKILEHEKPTIYNVFLFEEENMEYTYEQVFQPIFQDLIDDELSDFYLMRVVRYIYVTDKFQEKLLEEMYKIPFWLTKGEKTVRRVYWSENHILMWTSNAYLLRQKFGVDATYPEDKTNVGRLVMYLQSKEKNGFFEFLSPNYMDLTLSALLNLYDFSQNAQIKELANICITILLEEFMLTTNELGLSNTVTGRGKFNNLALEGMVYKSDVQEVLSVITGKSPLIPYYLPINFGKFTRSVGFLAHTSYNPTSALKTFEASIYVTKHFGFSKNEYMFEVDKDAFEETTLDLSINKYDQYLMQMSQGGYASPEYVKGLIRVVKKYDLFDSLYFQGLDFVKYIPEGVSSPVTLIAGTLSKGSIVNSEVKVWRNENAVLTSVSDFYPGHRGYQQIIWTASVGDVTVFSSVIVKNIETSVNDVSRDEMNYHLPRVKQVENLAIVSYNQNSDLSLLLGMGGELAILLEFQEEYLDQYSISNGWHFGKMNASYFAVYVACDDFQTVEKEVKVEIDTARYGIRSFNFCYDEKAVLFVIVGNDVLYGSFSDFMDRVLNTAEVEVQDSGQGKCVYSNLNFDGKFATQLFCRNLGNAHKFIMVAVFFIFYLSVLCFCCCRKKRKAWKQFYGVVTCKEPRETFKKQKVAHVEGEENKQKFGDEEMLEEGSSVITSSSAERLGYKSSITSSGSDSDGTITKRKESSEAVALF
eukprot:snap_masked-scaffold_13-processed-gene-5.27-mRNA-1 protein AED:1.00 eAED:1.00 QI:0/0/0/0/1/1/3/0/767